MASAQQISVEVKALEAVYPFRVARSAEQYDAWLKAYVEDLQPYAIEAIKAACQQWRRGPATKFPLLGELLAAVKQNVPNHAAKAEAWAEPTDGEYAEMSLREKMRTQQILGAEKQTTAFRHALKLGWDRNMATFPAECRPMLAMAENHFAEVKRLRDRLSAAREAA